MYKSSKQYQGRLNFEEPGLLIDCHGTISSASFWTNLGDVKLTKLADEVVFSQRKDLVNSWMLGEVSAEEVHRILAAELGVEFDWLWERFTTQARRLKINGLHQIAALRNTFRVAIVTVNVDTFSRFTVESKKLNNYADAVINSADHGTTKKCKDVGLFDIAITRLSCRLDNSILIDDKDDVCDYFARMGGHSICVRGVEQTIAVLNELLQICGEGKETNAVEVIKLLQQGKLPKIISWDEQVRSSY